MRYIDTSEIIVDADWVAIAKEQNRRNQYPPLTSLWSYFKAEFEDRFGKKCWYSESLNFGSVNPIDHFRPKSERIKGLPPFEQLKEVIEQVNINAGAGYPFLELSFSNFRYSCSIVNSPNKHDTIDKLTRGKWDYFPLSLKSSRATNVNEIENEEICFLDPCKVDDPELFTFTETGFIQANISVLKSNWTYCKVIVSIEAYHLHYFQFCEVRKEIWNECGKEIELIAGLYYKNPSTLDEQNNLSHLISCLHKRINKKTQFSAVAIDCIKYNRINHSWLNILFNDDMLKK